MKILKKVKEIRDRNGKLHFTRFAIVESRWFSVYVHRIYAADEDDHLHDHPWSFFNVVLKGTYVEEVMPSLDGYDPSTEYKPTLNTRGPCATAYRRSTKFHKIHSIIDGPVVTLNFMGPKNRTWGYLMHYEVEHELAYNMYGDRWGKVSYVWMDFDTYRKLMRDNASTYTVRAVRMTPAQAERHIRNYIEGNGNG